jgi:hypothetical protein
MRLLTFRIKRIRWVYSTDFRTSETAVGYGLDLVCLSQSSGRRKEYKSEGVIEALEKLAVNLLKKKKAWTFQWNICSKY